MDEQRARQPPPDRFSEIDDAVKRWLNSLDAGDIERWRQWAAIPEPVQKWLLTMDEERISRFKRWDALITWAEASGTYGRKAFYFLMGALGIYVTASTVWNRLMGKG